MRDRTVVDIVGHACTVVCGGRNSCNKAQYMCLGPMHSTCDAPTLQFNVVKNVSKISIVANVNFKLPVHGLT